MQRRRRTSDAGGPPHDLANLTAPDGDAMVDQPSRIRVTTRLGIADVRPLRRKDGALNARSEGGLEATRFRARHWFQLDAAGALARPLGGIALIPLLARVDGQGALAMQVARQAVSSSKGTRSR